MKTFLLLPLLLMGLPLLSAQDPAEQPAPTEQPTDKPADDKPEDAEPSTEIPADYVDYIKRVMPGMDPAGEHSLADLKSYSDKKKQHEYTERMAQLVLKYLSDLQMGPSLQKLFDHYSRGQFAEYPSFQVLHAILLAEYPESGLNADKSVEILSRLTRKNPGFAYGWYYLAQVELKVASRDSRPNLQAAIEKLNKAIEAYPGFTAAIYAKAEYMFVTSKAKDEVVSLIKPLLEGPLELTGESYEQCMALYASVVNFEEFQAMVKDHLRRPNLTARLRTRIVMTEAKRYLAERRYDDALRLFDELRESVSPAEDPIAALRLRQLGASFCFQKLDALSGERPAKQEEFDATFLELIKHHKIAAEIEQKYMPIALRGQDAERYLIALLEYARSQSTTGAIQLKNEEALNWVTQYLEDTDLSGSFRRRLEDIRDTIHLMLNPTEDGYINKWENYESAQDILKLLEALSVARNKVRLGTRGEAFTLERSMKFFVRQLNSSERKLVQHAAWLAAHTAAQRGGESLDFVGNALAERYEKEAELNSAEQLELAEDFSQAIRMVGVSSGMERIVRHLAKIGRETEKWRDFRRVVDGWCQTDFLKTVPNAPDKLNAVDRLSAEKSCDWLVTLADVINKGLVKQPGPAENSDEPAEGTD